MKYHFKKKKKEKQCFTKYLRNLLAIHDFKVLRF
jgi:hypothetical protein